MKNKYYYLLMIMALASCASNPTVVNQDGQVLEKSEGSALTHKNGDELIVIPDSFYIAMEKCGIPRFEGDKFIYQAAVGKALRSLYSSLPDEVFPRSRELTFKFGTVMAMENVIEKDVDIGAGNKNFCELYKSIPNFPSDDADTIDKFTSTLFDHATYGIFGVNLILDMDENSSN